MTLVRRSYPSYTTPNLSKVFDHLLSDNLFDWSTAKKNGYVPATNIKESDTEYAIEVAAPGLQKEDIQIKLDENLLTISSEKKEDSEEKKENYTRVEFSYQSFKRSFTLPEKADTEKVSASYDNGVLHLTIPKKEEALPEPPKVIEVQ